MKIYTRTGDDGMTSLFGGTRLPKNHVRIEAYGTVDELNAWVGLVRDQISDEYSTTVLKKLQDRLFAIGAHLAVDPDKKLPLPEVTDADITLIEDEIDRMTAQLSPLKHFILPGGHKLVSEIHVARTVCRRAERRVMALHQEVPVESVIIVFLNRLSDYLFVLSRWMALQLGIDEIKWNPRNE